jgi:uncharacterized protein with HEPN domain
MPPEQTYLFDIRQAAEKIRAYTQGIEKPNFLTDEPRHMTVIYQLIIIGEATKHLSDEFRAKNTAIPWRKMAGMRDVLIHDYHDVDLELVWETATQAIPELLRLLEPFISADESGDE